MKQRCRVVIVSKWQWLKATEVCTSWRYITQAVCCCKPLSVLLSFLRSLNFFFLPLSSSPFQDFFFLPPPSSPSQNFFFLFLSLILPGFLSPPHPHPGHPPHSSLYYPSSLTSAVLPILLTLFSSSLLPFPPSSTSPESQKVEAHEGWRGETDASATRA